LDAAGGGKWQDAQPTNVDPCFDHPTLTDLLDQNQISWRYYGKQADSIRLAPNAISHICNNTGPGTPCGTGSGSNQDWNNDVKNYVEGTNNLASFLRDLQNCNLAQVTWVTPDGRWSDHLTQNKGLGPDYVADIVNAVGQGMPNSTCNPLGSPIYWNNTVIMIVWDDWGGFYDHVSPDGLDGPGIGYPNKTGEQYVYGFRVPLLVVSTYLKQTSQTYTGYISGTKQNPITYDFGSILKFIENTFLPLNTFINPSYPYADQSSLSARMISLISSSVLPKLASIRFNPSHWWPTRSATKANACRISVMQLVSSSTRVAQRTPTTTRYGRHQCGRWGAPSTRCVLTQVRDASRTIIPP
jgi:hypothetical protein